MTIELKMYGVSDDLVVIEILDADAGKKVLDDDEVGGPAEFIVSDKDPVSGEDVVTHLRMEYAPGPGPCWSVMAQPLDEWIGMVPVTVQHHVERGEIGYSVWVSMYVTDHCVIEQQGEFDDDDCPGFTWRGPLAQAEHSG